jgi:hypothetical protein
VRFDVYLEPSSLLGREHTSIEQSASGTVHDVHNPRVMISKHWLAFRIGTIALAFCAILSARPNSAKRHRHSYRNFNSTYTSPNNSAAPAASPAHNNSYCVNCARDSRGRIARSSGAQHAFRQANPCPSTGSTSGRCRGYVIDHIRALKHGGSDTPDNMQWQTREEAKAKDKIE